MFGITVVAAIAVGAMRLVLLPFQRSRDRIGARACHFWARTLCPVIGLRIRVSGPVPRETPFLVAANHLSYLDILVLAATYPSLFVAKREIAGWPLLGWVVGTAGTLWVDRDRARDVVRAGEEMVRRFERGAGLTIFPEGFAGSGDGVRPFLPSLLEPAAREKVPCHAVAISYATPAEAGPASAIVPWHDSSHFLRHLGRVLGVRRIEVGLRFAPETVTSAERKELAARLHREVAALFTPLATP